MTDTSVTAVGSRPSVLSDPNMRWYLGGQFVSLTGTLLQSAVLALLIVTITSKSEAASWTGIMWALGLVPGAFFGPFAGILLDRWNKRNVLIATSVIGMIQALCLAYLTYTNQITMWEINALALVLGLANAVDGPGRNAIVKDIVADHRNVRQAAKMFSSLYNFAQIAGPSFAGYLVIHVGYPTTFVLNALSYILLIIALMKVRLAVVSPPIVPVRRSGMIREVVDGGRYTFSVPGIRLCILLAAWLNIFGFTYYLLLAVINKYMLGGSPIGFSHLSAANGIGSLCGAVIAIAVGEKRCHKILVVIGAILTGCALICLSRTQSLNPALIFTFLAGAGFMVSFLSLRSSITHLTKREAVGVVTGYTFTFFYGSMMVSAFCCGPIADRYGCPSVLVGSGIALLLMAAITPFLPGINELDKPA